ncbi:unnamed protein product [Protopolystoma xenopodis]|uniref:Uncharacterized protein n=1 Tax=Protopolystoma xenopodis TaxID=117903 RepID=A0A3S5B1D2_9PLAT|nr:unnamed protein product [Protopolystoma xenopodis]
MPAQLPVWVCRVFRLTCEPTDKWASTRQPIEQSCREVAQSAVSRVHQFVHEGPGVRHKRGRLIGSIEEKREFRQLSWKGPTGSMPMVKAFCVEFLSVVLPTGPFSSDTDCSCSPASGGTRANDVWAERRIRPLRNHTIHSFGLLKAEMLYQWTVVFLPLNTTYY